MKQTIIILLISLLFACKKNSKTSDDIQIHDNDIIEKQEELKSSFYGNYVTNSYAKRYEGYDWVAVSVKKSGDNSIFISIRSRADKKRPTCTFDTKAFKIDDYSFESIYDGIKIIFEFKGDTITISTEKQEDSGVLNFFCNGGATMAGTYKKINEALDNKQVDDILFSKLLNLQGIGFNISSNEKNGKNTLNIFTFGLEEHDYNESFHIVGEHVIDAEVEDLNSDGSPELFVYTQSNDNKAKVKVYGFSVNNKKTMSQVYFQPTKENPKINQGYMGNDEFSVVENSLVQRFPIYKEIDTTGNPTSGTRQISYKLIEGEAMKKLEVDRITNY